MLRARAGGLFTAIGVIAFLCDGPAAAASGSTLTVSAATVANGATVTFAYSTPSSTVTSTNWIGIYEPGQKPGDVASTTWQEAPGASGTVTFSTSTLDGVGHYQAYYLYDNEYRHLAGPVAFQVVGAVPAPAPRFHEAVTGQGGSALSDPCGVALDPKGNVWVADTGNSRVEEFSSSGRPLEAFGDTGRARLNHPEGIAVDSNDDVWVADTGNNRVVEFSAEGQVLRVVGFYGDGAGQLASPSGLVVSPSGNVYVADMNNNRVEEFDSSGRYLSQISVATPNGIALDPGGNIWVSSPSYADGNAVYEFDPAGSEVASFGSTQASYGAMSNIAGIGLDTSGLVYVAQEDYGFVTVYDPNGNFDTEFGLQSSPSKAAEALEFPRQIVVGPNKDVWVADSGNNRVVEFVPAGSSRGGRTLTLGGLGVGDLAALSSALLALGVMVFGPLGRKAWTPSPAGRPIIPRSMR